MDKPLRATVVRESPRAAQPAGICLPLKDHQLAMLQRCIDIEKQALMSPFKMGFMADAVSAGKCFAPGTMILMHSGDRRPVESIEVGDQLMGDDGTPRTVLNLGKGRDEMFEIKPCNGDPSFTVNSEHILCVVPARAYKRIGSTVQIMSAHGHYEVEYHEDEATAAAAVPRNDDVACVLVWNFLKLPERWRSSFRSYRRPLTFNDSRQDVQPYQVGRWLASTDLSLNDVMYTAGLTDRSRMPDNYRVTSRHRQLQLLAGVLDVTASVDGDGCYVIKELPRGIRDDVVFVARSLGFVVSTHPVIKVSGSKLHQVPVRREDLKVHPRLFLKDDLSYAFNVISKGPGSYHGFEINGNRRFMLADLTVAHNTAVSLALPLAEKMAYRRASLNIIVVPQNICMQWMEEVDKFTGSALKTLLLVEYSSVADLTFSPSSIAQYDIVLTTPMFFQTIADFCERANVRARRVIIDEADTIANMVSRKIPGAMTWFVSATMDRLPQSEQGMVQVGKHVESFEEEGPVNPRAAVKGSLRAEELGTYEIPARLLHTGERVCRCDAAWVGESFGIPPPIKHKVVVSNVIMDVLNHITFAGLLKPKNLESANARDFRNLQLGTHDEFEILPTLVKRYEQRRTEAKTTLNQLKGQSCLEKRIQDCHDEVKLTTDYINLIRSQAAFFNLCQGTFESLGQPDRKGPLVTSCMVCKGCGAGLSAPWFQAHPKANCLRCGGSELNEMNPGLPFKAENKVVVMADMIRRRYAEAEDKPRIMVFAKYTQAFSELRRLLSDTDLKIKEADAGTVKAADKMLTDFKSGEIDVLLAESNLFCSGMNLPEVTDVCFLHVVHAYSTKQIAGRAQRPGRKGPCHIHTFLHDNETSAYND